MSTSISHLKDADMQAAPLALARAANKARRLAEQTGTPWIVREAAVPPDEPSTPESDPGSIPDTASSPTGSA